MTFSQRIGLTPATKIVQHESMDDELRIGLWNTLTLCYWENYLPDIRPSSSGRIDHVRGSNFESLAGMLHIFHFKQPIDTMKTYWGDYLKEIRARYFAFSWSEVYEFIEFVAQQDSSWSTLFMKTCNSQLHRENSAYRFVDGKITEITSGEEITEIEAAIEQSQPYSGVKTHLTTALSLMSSRTNPDYRNSIKESISAVDSLVKKLNGDESLTLGDALKKLEKAKQLHPALKEAFLKLYGYTSDAGGIRHALTTEADNTKAEARFMLITCSAFINFCIDTIEVG